MVVKEACLAMAYPIKPRPAHPYIVFGINACVFIYFRPILLFTTERMPVAKAVKENFAPAATGLIAGPEPFCNEADTNELARVALFEPRLPLANDASFMAPGTIATRLAKAFR
jgi:hypothetical protein